MPISPYSTPIQYEYKPLNLSAFAAPLSEMQQKFDIATEAVDAADFTLANLPYGTDPERAKELIKTVKSKRDELAKNLSETKNYKQAASKLRELNTLWQKDPELNALETNAKLWAQRDKEERERIDKPGGITRDQYLQWREEELHKYKKGEGAKFEADASNPEGTYNVITGSTGRLADLDKEFRDLQIEIAKMNPEKSISYFTQNGVSMSPEEKVSFQTTINSKVADEIARETEKYLRKIPKFKDWGTEVARYNYNQATEFGENLGPIAKPLTDEAVNNIDEQIKYNLKNTKGFKDSEDYKNLLDTREDLAVMAQTGEYDSGMVQALYTQQHLNNLYGSQDIANILAYKNSKVTGSVRKNYEWEAQQAAAAKAAEAGGVSVIPTTDAKFSIESLSKEKRTSGKDLAVTNRKINDLVDGNIRAAILGAEGSDLRKKLLNNPDQVRARQELLLGAITKSIAQGGDWSTMQSIANANGITMGEGRARAIWQSMTKNNNVGISNYSRYLDESKESYEKYNTASSLMGEIKKTVTTTDDYKTFLSGLASYRPTDFEVGSLGEKTRDDLTAAQKKLFNINNYSEEQLKKIGKSKPSTLSKATGWADQLSLEEVAKLKGYKNFKDAVDKGYNFEGFKFMEITKKSGEKGSSSWIWGTDNYENQSVQAMLTRKQQEIYNKSSEKNAMALRVIGTPAVDKTLTSFFAAPSDILTYDPAYSKDWSNQPGFTEKGEVAPGTTINTKIPVRFVSHGGKLLYEVPIFYYKDGEKTQGTAVVDAKSSLSTKNLALLDNLDLNSQGDNDADKEVNDAIKVAKFDTKFKGNNLSPQLIESVNPSIGTKGVNLYSVPFDNASRLQVVKMQLEKGSAPVLMIAQIDTNSGKVLGYLNNPETGNTWYEDATLNTAADAAKNIIIQTLGE